MTIQKILIANRGEIAARISRTLKKLSLPSVAVYHALDADGVAVRQADEAVRLYGSTPVAAYLDIDAIVEACRKTGADAVHPGYGFLAENARFAARLKEEGITFIGPPADVIELMGDKIRARRFCLDNGFPLAPSVAEDGDSGNFLDRVRELGAPLLIKAAAGGGGRGIHVVRDIKDLDLAVRLAAEEAQRYFGNPAIYAERLIERPRHIEVQILADGHGNVLHLWERECSIQRRFQKIIEEAPAPNLDGTVRDGICGTAVKIASAAGYINAGTVEFILAPGGQFFFLEMNTHIQVEHTVTEEITGLDLIEQQIRIAAGEEIKFTQDEVLLDGAAVEVRLYAEDTDDDFRPATGRLLRYDLNGAVRVDSGFEAGQMVTPAFDSMLAKLTAHGPTREEAISSLRKILQTSRIVGVTTNRDYLSSILSHPAFLEGRIHTGFVEEYSDDLISPELSEEQRDVLLVAAALVSRDFTGGDIEASHMHAAMGGWRN